MKQETRKPSGEVDPAWRIGIVLSSYHPELVEAMAKSAHMYLEAAGIRNIQEFRAPGSFELPLIGRTLAKEASVDALIGIGVIVQGETAHADVIAREAARGMMDVQTQFGIPFAFEVLLVGTKEQAKERANRGAEAAAAVLHSLAEMRRIRS